MFETFHDVESMKELNYNNVLISFMGGVLALTRAEVSPRNYAPSFKKRTINAETNNGLWEHTMYLDDKKATEQQHILRPC